MNTASKNKLSLKTLTASKMCSETRLSKLVVTDPSDFQASLPSSVIFNYLYITLCYNGMSASSQNLYVEALIPREMVFGGGGLWKVIRS